MSIFQKPKQSFLNLKIVYKFLFVAAFFVIGFAAIAYAFANGMQADLFYALVAAILCTTMLVLWWVVVNGIIRPVSHLQTVINGIAAGNLTARVDAASQDEIGKLANALDALFDEKRASLAKIEHQYQQLNAAIVALFSPQNVTGKVSDSLNLLTGLMTVTLKEVAHISARVNAASVKVKQQAGNAMLFADHQHKEIAVALEELNGGLNTMDKVARFSKITHKESERTLLTAESAAEAVAKTVASINGIRKMVRETEKNLTRLGERSQDMAGAVNIINNMAERTHVLSLNAAMQVAAASDAEKSFRVMANEVERLAESSREATEKMAKLVKNIQEDTSDTQKSMNTVISQITDVAQQAEAAGKKTKESQATTESLVAAVKKIATVTIAQLEIGKDLKEHLQNVQTSSLKSNEQRQQQITLSDNLAKDAHELNVKVNVFKLPE